MRSENISFHLLGCGIAESARHSGHACVWRSALPRSGQEQRPSIQKLDIYDRMQFDGVGLGPDVDLLAENRRT
jgi:hypothetical protein